MNSTNPIIVTENIEKTLWEAVRGIDESIMMLNHKGDHFKEVNEPKLDAMYFQKANETARRKDTIRLLEFGRGGNFRLH
jgi:two-component system, chemotaxis family, protein-glutamate methylesterase/glutaminase